MKSILLQLFCLLVVTRGILAEDDDLVYSDADIALANSHHALPPVAGWLVIMQRFDFSVDFNRSWVEYKNGFGESGGQKEFWLGNEQIYQLTYLEYYDSLRIELLTNGALFHASYNFYLESEDQKYAIHLQGFSGNAGDSLTNTTVRKDFYHDGMSFSTPDVENDKSPTYNCGKKYKAGWWYNACWYACLTCKEGDNFKWSTLDNLPSKGNLVGARMMIKVK